MLIDYKPYTLHDVTYDIRYVISMEHGKHYMRSHLEIKTDKAKQATIGYIDTDRFVLTQNVQDLWSIPDLEQVSSMWIGKHELMLSTIPFRFAIIPEKTLNDSKPIIC